MKNTHLHIKIESEIKGILNDAAQCRGVNLSNFVIKAALNEAMSIKEIRDKYGDKIPDDKVKNRPRWARESNGVQLSEHTIRCLVGAGHTSKRQIRNGFEEGYSFDEILNMGPRCYQELAKWLGH